MNISCSNQDPCPVILDSKCVIYEGENLLYIGVNTNDNFRTALQNINTAIGDIVLAGGITQLTGDVLATGPGVTPATLATVNSTPGQYGSSTAIPKVTVDGKGRVTAISTDPVFIPSGALNFIGDVTGSGNTGSDTTLTLKTVNSNVYTTNNFLKFAVNAKGLITSATPVLSSDIITTLGYTPYNSTNPAGYISGITGPMVVTALGYTPYNSTNPAGYISSISGIAAGGELAGTYPNPTLVNAAVTGKVLTGLNLTPGGTILDTDSILQAFGKLQNQLSALLGGVSYQGTWNATTNIPTIVSNVGTKGHYYIVSVAGNTDINGISDWKVGDWIIFNGAAWDKVDNTDAVSSVNGFTGAVSLTTDNIPEALTNQYFTTARARLALSGGTGISYDNITGVITNTITQYTDALARQAISLTTVGSSGAATYNNVTGVLNIPIYSPDLSGYVPVSRTLTINGTTYDLSADRSWTIAAGPSGGLAGQILSKNSDTDYDYVWIDNFADWTSTVKEYVKASEPINKGQAVYVSSADGTNIIVSKASNTSEATSSKTVGLLAQTLATNGKGYVITEGLLSGLNTSTAIIGDPVWLGVNGDLIYGLINKPYAPAHLVYIGVVVRVNLNNGEIFIQPQNGFEMQELHNVSALNPANNAILAYSTATSLWEKNTIAGVLGYTPADNSLVVHLAGTETITGAKTFTANLTADASALFSYGILLKDGASSVATGYFGIASLGPTTLGFQSSGGRAFDLIMPTSGGAVTIPNGSGTLAFTSNLSSYVPTTRTLTINGTTYDLSADRTWTIAAGVSSFNTRTGAITLVSTDVTSALGFSPYNATNPAGYITSSALSSYLPLTGGTLTGSLGINSTSLTGYSFRNSRNLTGATTTYANYADGQIQTDATNLSHYFFSEANIAASATVTGIYHFKASQGTFGAGSSLTVQAGLVIDSSLSGATNNYGIISNINAATNNWNLYIGGTAKNWIASSLGIGAGLSNPTATLDVNGTFKASGAATFSSSVTATNLYLGSLTNEQMMISGTGSRGIGVSTITSGDPFVRLYDNTTIKADMWWDRTGGFMGINSLGAGSKTCINPFGGNVGIGTSSPSIYATLSLNKDGASNYSGVNITNANSSANFFVGVGGSSVSNTSLQNNAYVLNAAATALILGTSDTERMRITSGGNVLIGTTTDNGLKLQVNGNLSANSIYAYNGNLTCTGTASNTIAAGPYTSIVNSGNSYQILQQLNASYNLDFWSYRGGWTNVSRIDGSSGAYTALSDSNKKKDFEESTIGLNEVLQLKPTLFRFITDDENSSKQLGFLAQEVKDVIPQAYVEQDNFIGLQDRPIIAALVKSTQEIVETYDNKIALLEAQIDELKALIAAK